MTLAVSDPFVYLFGDDTSAAPAPELDPIDDALDGSVVAAPPLDWTSMLDFNEAGGIKPTLHNIELLLKNDPRVVGLPQLNLFTQETVQRTVPGTKAKPRENPAKETRQLTGPVWEVFDTVNGETWSSSRDFSIRSILEAPKTQGGYGIKLTDRDLKAATVLAAWENSFHPVREYLSGLVWDGVRRVETLFVDYLATDNNAYTRSVARILMIAGVTRIFEPGAKYDFAVILEGLQGRGKSTFIRTLGKRWFAELEGDFSDDKAMVEKMQGAWITEIPELSSFGRTDVRAIKAFISRQTDKVRLAYEARAAEFPRQCVFIGSTNDKEYLKDDTGGRRFFPMECRAKMIDSARLRGNVNQLWAEAMSLYTNMRKAQPKDDLPLYLVNAEAAVEAERLQESRRVESVDDGQAGRISSWLDRPVSNGGFDDANEGTDGQPRNLTCLLQVWCEALGGDPKSYTQTSAQSLGRAMRLIPGWSMEGKFFNFPAPYGRQRLYLREGTARPIAGLNPES